MVNRDPLPVLLENRQVNRLIALVVPVIAAALLTSCAASEPTADEKQVAELNSGDEIDAGVFCEEFLKQRIPNPGDAEFDFMSNSNTPVKNGWIVMGHYDADVRREFRCEVVQAKDSDGWRLVGLSVDGKNIMNRRL